MHKGYNGSAKSETMDIGMKKILAVVVVLLLLTVGVVVGETNKSDNTSTNSFELVARVNTEGSSVFVAESYLDELKQTYPDIDVTKMDGLFYDLVDGVAQPNDNYAKYWNNMVIGTPGNTSIQHKMIERFVTSMHYNGQEMRFERYEHGAAMQNGVVYYDTTLTNLNVWIASTHIDAGTIWQPVCGAIEANSDRPADRIMSSAQMEPHHACCVIGGVTSYLESNEDIVIRFLAAYIESVNAVNNAITAGSGTDYTNLVSLAADQTGQSAEVIHNALREVTYTYGMSDSTDDQTNPLASLRSNIMELADMFSSDGTFRRTLESLGFNNSAEFADAFVNDYYLSKALALVEQVQNDPSVLNDFDFARVTVGVISGDVHQIAIHYGSTYGDGTYNNFFSKYNLAVNLHGATNGAGVATSLQNGAVSLGFLGLPPATTTVVNSSLVTSSTYTVSGTVTDSSGNPVVNHTVSLMDGTETVASATTDENGQYTMTVRDGATGTFVCGEIQQRISLVYKDMTVNLSAGGS